MDAVTERYKTRTEAGSPASVRPLVRAGGLEPPRLAAPDPKSGLATNYNTPADAGAKIVFFY